MPLVPRHLNPKFLGPAKCRQPRKDARAKGQRLNGKVFKLSAFCLQPLALLLALVMPCAAPAAGVRVRDLVMVAGARDNQLVGYGIVSRVLRTVVDEARAKGIRAAKFRMGVVNAVRRSTRGMTVSQLLMVPGVMPVACSAARIRRRKSSGFSPHR